MEFQQWLQGNLWEEPISKEQVAEKIRKSPSYPALLKAVTSFYKSLFGNVERMADFEEEPWRLLTAHSSVMNAKSARAKTMMTLSNAIFRETGLPRKPQGKFRGMDGVDFEKLGLEP